MHDWQISNEDRDGVIPSSQTRSASPENICREIATEMIGNSLIIRVEKDRNRSKKNRARYDPPCDCDIAEIKRPSKTEGPRIVSAGDDNRIVFQVQSAASSGRNTSSDSRCIAYRLGGCDANDRRGRSITIHPEMGGQGTREVHTERAREGGRDVFFLRMKKKSDGNDAEQRKVELELRTPRGPTPPPTTSELREERLETAVEKLEPKKRTVEKKSKKKRGRKKK